MWLCLSETKISDELSGRNSRIKDRDGAVGEMAFDQLHIFQGGQSAVSQCPSFGNKTQMIVVESLSMSEDVMFQSMMWMN
jgi:hypothetical protein